MKLGIIGGTGLGEFDGLTGMHEENPVTPYGKPSSPLKTGQCGGCEIVFLARHGAGHTILPHEINYKANIAAMKMAGVTHIVSIAAVGSLRKKHHPRDIVLPDQFFDRSKQPPESQTFFGNGIAGHIAFAEPVCPELVRMVGDELEKAIAASDDPARRVFRSGTYVNMAGPAFSTRAESVFYRQMGFSVIGMTNLNEAKLAREAEICYCTAAFVTDYDAWSQSESAVDLNTILGHLSANTSLAKALIPRLAERMSDLQRKCGCSGALAGTIVTAQDKITDELRRKNALIFGKYLETK